MSCSRHWRRVLVEAANQTLSDRQREELNDHVVGCRVCREELASVRETLTLVERTMPRPPNPGTLNAWSRVAQGLADAEAANAPGARFSFGLTSALMGAAAMLVIGVGIGMQLVSTPVGEPVAELPAPESSPATPTAQQRYTRFLERATPLLLAVANRAGDRPVTESVSFDTQAEQTLAASLADDANSLGEQLHVAGLGREARLIGDLEIVFMQIANLPSAEYPDSMHLVRATLEQRAILFQLTVEEMRESGSQTTPLG